MYITTQFQLAQCFDTVTYFTCKLSLLGYIFFSPPLFTLPHRANMSTPAFSTPPFVTVPLCPSRKFHQPACSADMMVPMLAVGIEHIGRKYE